MYSIAQHAVANGYGKIEYLRAQPIARSSRVSTTASPRSAASPEVAARGAGGAMGFAMAEILSDPLVRGVSKHIRARGAEGVRSAPPVLRPRARGRVWRPPDGRRRARDLRVGTDRTPSASRVRVAFTGSPR